MKQEFIKKWRTWWKFQKEETELTEAFEKELDAIIEQEMASINLVKADISKTKPDVDFRPTEDWTKIII